jgi:hypothetical protein
MDLYIPPVVAVIGGAAIVGLCFAFRIPIFILGVLSLVLLIYTVVLSLNMFKNEYENVNILKSLSSIIPFVSSNTLGPILIIGVVIILALGYIINLFGIKGMITNASMPSISNYMNRSSYISPNSQSANYTIDRNIDRSINQFNTTAYKSAFNRAL